MMNNYFVHILFVIALVLKFSTLDAQLSEQVTESLSETLQELVESNNINGISVGVRKIGVGDWLSTVGVSHDEVLLDESFYFGIGSNTKLFTSVLCLKLVENGVISLEDTVGFWLDDYPNINSGATIKQLLQHHSGHNDYTNNTQLLLGEIQNNPLRIWTPDEILAEVGTPVGKPGELVFYSSTNYILAAMIMEKATGKLFHKMIKDSILVPLGLEEFYFEGFEEIPVPYAHPFVFSQDYASVPRIALGTLTWAAGCMVSRPSSMLDWYEKLFTSELLSAESFAAMMDFIEWPDDLDGNRMGLGIYEVNEGAKQYYGHGGRTVGYASFTLFDPDCGAVISVMINETFSDPRLVATTLGAQLCELLETSSQEIKVKPARLSLKPNPVANFLTFEINDKAHIQKVEIVDFSGKTVLIDIEGRNSEGIINLMSLENGVYLLRLHLDSGETLIDKFVKI